MSVTMVTLKKKTYPNICFNVQSSNVQFQNTILVYEFTVTDLHIRVGTERSSTMKANHGRIEKKKRQKERSESRQSVKAGLFSENLHCRRYCL